MEPYVNSILEKVPSDIRLTSKEYISKHMSIFEPKEYVMGQTVHLDHYHFIIFHSQPPILKIDRKEYQFQKRSLISLEPGRDLMVVPFSEKPICDYFSISISKDFFRKIALEALGKDSVEFKRMEYLYSRQLLDLATTFKHELDNYGDKYPSMVNSIATQIAFQLIRDLNAYDHLFRKSGCNDKKYINKAMEFMENNFAGNITMEEVSREIYVSQAHFERMFKYHVGQTPHQYLVAIRMDYAKKMLLRESSTVEEIARGCGFVSVSHFSTVFKHVVGLSPSDYRKIRIDP